METETRQEASVLNAPDQDRNQRLARRHKRIGVALAIIGLIGLVDSLIGSVISISILVLINAVLPFETTARITAAVIGIVKGFWILFLAAALGESIRAKRIAAGKVSRSFRLWR